MFHVGRMHDAELNVAGDLGDLCCSLANDVAAQDLRGRAVDDELAKPHLSTVDDRSDGRVEAHDRRDDIVGLARFGLGEARTRVFGLGEARGHMNGDEERTMLHEKGVWTEK